MTKFWVKYYEVYCFHYLSRYPPLSNTVIKHLTAFEPRALCWQSASYPEWKSNNGSCSCRILDRRNNQDKIVPSVTLGDLPEENIFVGKLNFLPLSLLLPITSFLFSHSNLFKSLFLTLSLSLPLSFSPSVSLPDSSALLQDRRSSRTYCSLRGTDQWFTTTYMTVYWKRITLLITTHSLIELLSCGCLRCLLMRCVLHCHRCCHSYCYIHCYIHCHRWCHSYCVIHCHKHCLRYCHSYCNIHCHKHCIRCCYIHCHKHCLRYYHNHCHSYCYIRCHKHCDRHCHRYCHRHLHKHCHRRCHKHCHRQSKVLQ